MSQQSAAPSPSPSYSATSLELTRSIPKAEKKAQGIFFTPPAIIAKNMAILEQYFGAAAAATEDETGGDIGENIEVNGAVPLEILEPSCGSGEYITAVTRMCAAVAPARPVTVTGVEYNTTIYNRISTAYGRQPAGARPQLDIRIRHADFITEPFAESRYDLIVGNPPYYVLKKASVAGEYHPHFDGRPNIFVLFIIKALRLLKPRGILNFVLPRNFLTCLYYDKTRKLIADSCEILHIVDCDAVAGTDARYLDTKQPTVILIVRKRAPGELHSQMILTPPGTGYTIFGESAVVARLRELSVGTTTLHWMGFKVSVGSVVWNQQKANLVSQAAKGKAKNTIARLIYSSDIVDNTLGMKSYDNPAKKNYIRKHGRTGPLLVINRGYGVGEYKLTYCLIDEGDDFHYLIENHLMCVLSTAELPRAALIEKYTKIIASLNDPRTAEFVKLYFSNSAINTTELNHVLPIY